MASILMRWVRPGFQFLELIGQLLTPRPFFGRHSVLNRATKAGLKLEGYSGLGALHHQVRAHLLNCVSCLSRRYLPNPQPAVRGGAPSLRSQGSSKKGLEDIQRSGVELGHSQLQVVRSGGPSVLDEDAALSVHEASRPDQPLFTGQSGWQRKMWPPAAARLLRRGMGRASSFHALIVHRAHSIAVGRPPAGVHKTEPFRFAHEVIISGVPNG